MVGVFDVEGAFGRFAGRVLAHELPDLPDDRLAETVAFVCRRARQTPGPLRVGLIALASSVGAAERIADPDTLTDWLRRTSWPFVGELARLVRSLGFAYVWETWPSTAPTGAPDAAAA